MKRWEEKNRDEGVEIVVRAELVGQKSHQPWFQWGDIYNSYVRRVK